MIIANRLFVSQSNTKQRRRGQTIEKARVISERRPCYPPPPPPPVLDSVNVSRLPLELLKIRERREQNFLQYIKNFDAQIGHNLISWHSQSA